MAPNWNNTVLLGELFTTEMTYDALNRPVTIKHPGNTIVSYIYDKGGMLKQVLHGAVQYIANDAHGNMTKMPNVSSMGWDYKDQLISAANGSTFTSYFSYDAEGNRTRKVTVKGSVREERYYINGYELYRKYTGTSLTTERKTVNISDNEKVFVRMEGEAIRYLYDNHLGSACLELDEYGYIISYEEYHPFGTTSYRAGRSATEVSWKRYKYCGKERDEETGLYYYGARYYAAWLCRFVSVDPLQHKQPGKTPYHYCSNNPINRIDPTGGADFYFKGKWIGTDGRDDKQIGIVTSKSLRKEIANNTKQGNVSDYGQLENGDTKSGLFAIHSDVLNESYTTLGQALKDGQKSEYVKVMDRKGDSCFEVKHQHKSPEIETLVGRSTVPGGSAPKGDVSIHSHPTGADMDTKGRVASSSASVPSEIGMRGGDKEFFLDFKMNIIVGKIGLANSESFVKSVNPLVTEQRIVDNREAGIFIFDSNTKNIGEVSQEETHSILFEDKGKVYNEFMQKQKIINQ